MYIICSYFYCMVQLIEIQQSIRKKLICEKLIEKIFLKNQCGEFQMGRIQFPGMFLKGGNKDNVVVR
ncbi:hypothetical protein D3C71_906380 [compost metagenome]